MKQTFLKHINNYFLKSIFLTLLIISGGCQFYHDTATHYNSYFLAKEGMDLFEQEIFDENVDDYNDVLSILIPIDSNKTLSHKDQLDYIITKASRPIKFHKASDWIDECYLLVGWVRLYEEDYDNALTTFKYINAKFADPNSRHAALNALLRMFIELDEEANMILVKDIIKQQKQPYNKVNTKEYHLNLAHYYRNKVNFKKSIQHLRLAVDLEDNKHKKARYYFILGQMLEEENKVDNAYRAYTKAEKFSKTNELEFQADISAYSMQPVDFNDEKQAKKIQKYFDKKLKDHNNWDNRDKIYYEMAQFEMRKPDYDRALKEFNESVQVSTSNKIQKGHSYLESGIIYYDEKKDYIAASAYYDSALQNFDESVYGYEEIKEKAEYLRDLAKYIKIINDQERLLQLYDMNDEERSAFLEEEYQKEKDEIILRAQYAKENEKKKQRPATSESASFSNKETKEFYFYNSTAVAQGKAQFLKNWGSRPLEDNWRRSNKMDFASNDINPEQGDNPSPSKGRNTKNNANNDEEENVDLFANLKSVEERKQEVPTSEEELVGINKKLADALFELGKVYLYKVKTPDNALANFHRFLDNYPEDENAYEVAYLVYVICLDYEECDSDVAKKYLIDNYPDCLYSKVLVNPNYVKETNERENYIRDLYSSAYNLYLSGNYNASDKKLNELLNDFPQNTYEEKGRFLRVLLVGRTTKYYKIFKKSLDDYLKIYPEGEFSAIAKGMLSEITDNRLKNGYIPGRYHDFEITIDE
ncbi:hypothetical protein EI427_00335 [Flammeovirga pectinis]|uniref:Tetratricopeptide repeat protein n=1 Tax=Flammeovirga pectinis TaxID=2494373 RepID=A0A3Q9FLQ5_9BACT|nr:hypothetical protein [Flammeovirga pectinis]AZQ60707.1 hypothetical protein EI427_00335 [Flammeovirga pectinis]